jgi:hypothetical protein
MESVFPFQQRRPRRLKNQLDDPICRTEQKDGGSYPEDELINGHAVDEAEAEF